ncbi:MerR family transcriptional regulator [Fibrisoma limi]|uniref:MerR family transcriptional regulator n=1 Tax=Fibrisoma limi TaxID=663275 RepID=UPI001E4777F3|nr:MerR family transcriptional regulator [Fibrisoma limi]
MVRTNRTQAIPGETNYGPQTTNYKQSGRKFTAKLAFFQEGQEVCRMEQPGKRYYSIREVADMFSTNTSKLRFYETEFPTLKPKKNRAGDRIYTQADIDHLKEIFELIDGKGFTLAGARDYLKSRISSQRENARIIARLNEIKAFLQQVRNSLDAPDAVSTTQSPDQPASAEYPAPLHPEPGTPPE